MAFHTILPGLDADEVKGYDTVLCDLDGCLVAGGRLLPGARDFAGKVGQRLWIVSNNSSDTAQTLAAKLNELGLDIPETRILLAGEKAVDHLAQTDPSASLRCFADAPVRTKAEQSGFDLSPERADYVLLARMAAFNLECLERAVADLNGGARLLVANTDKTHPGPGGNPVPETGAWLAALQACLPGVSYESFGKPATNLLREALRQAGSQVQDTVFVGDNPDTDGKAARQMGMGFFEIRRAAGPARAADQAGQIPAGDLPC